MFQCITELINKTLNEMFVMYTQLTFVISMSETLALNASQLLSAFAGAVLLCPAVRVQDSIACL